MRMISSEALDIRVSDADLPILSAVATRVLALLGQGDPNIKELEALVRLDPGLTSRILRLANSPLYGGMVEFKSIEQAMVRLGVSALKQTVLIAATGEVFDGEDDFARSLWDHSIATAVTSQTIAEQVGGVSTEEAFVAGMLHDIGKLIIYGQAENEYAELEVEARTEGRRFFECEQENIQYCTHETIGSLVGRKWCLAPDMLEVMRFHHVVERDESIAERSSRIVLVVSAANILANQLGMGAEAPELMNVLESIPAAQLGLNEEMIENLTETLPEIVSSQKSAFQ